MGKIYLSFIIILSTFVSVVTMLSYQGYAYNLNSYEEEKSPKPPVAFYDNDYIQDNDNDNEINVEKKQNEKNSNISDHSEKDELAKEKNMSEQEFKIEKNNENSNINASNGNTVKNYKTKDINEDIYLLDSSDSLKDYSNSDIKENEQSVFKVSTGEIEGNLTISDKIRLLYISMQLGKEDYKKVEQYLYAENAEEGVLQALKLLKENLSEKEYQKVRKIAGRFIDMDAAEGLY